MGHFFEFFWFLSKIRNSRQKNCNCWKDKRSLVGIFDFCAITPIAGSISDHFPRQWQIHFSKSEFKNGHISRFGFVFQVIQVISSGKFFTAEEVDLSFISSIWIHEYDFKGFLLEKRLWKGFPIKCSNSGINESTPQTQSNVIWISSKAELEISFLNSLLEMWVWESGPKIDPATGVSRQLISKSQFPHPISVVVTIYGTRFDLRDSERRAPEIKFSMRICNMILISKCRRDYVLVLFTCLSRSSAQWQNPIFPASKHLFFRKSPLRSGSPNASPEVMHRPRSQSNFEKRIPFENCSSFSKITFSISVESPRIFQCLFSIPAGHWVRQIDGDLPRRFFCQRYSQPCDQQDRKIRTIRKSAARWRGRRARGYRKSILRANLLHVPDIKMQRWSIISRLYK